MSPQRVLVVYDSIYGNTEKIARAIGEAISNDVSVIRVGGVKPSDLHGFDIVILGSPTHGGRPTKTMSEFMKRITGDDIKGVRVAVFDTRMPARWVGLFGFAAGRIADDLRRKGAHITAEPEPFFVLGRDGPLKDGELERAAAWAKKIWS
jgi:flavodoxin I